MTTELNLFKDFAICSVDELRGEKIRMAETTSSHHLKAVAWSKVLSPTQHKIGHFGDVLPSQSLGSVLKRLQTGQN